jgi:trehalose 6-phosphate synthase
MPGHVTVPTRTTWTAETLRAWVHDEFGADQVLVLANRQPFTHACEPNGRVVVRHSASGLVNALEPLVRATHGVWIAHGSGEADRLPVDRRDGLSVPPDNPAYRLRRVWLEDHEVRGYYDGFANQALWPLCHRVHVRPVFRSDDFNMYWNVNGRFVDALCEEARTASPVVLVQDYHFALAPRMIRERLPQSAVAAFWHIPWPVWAAFEVCPWGRHLIEGLLGADVLGFQTRADCRNFLDAVARCLEAHVDREQETITYAGHRTMVRAYPASIEWPNRWVEQAPAIEACRDEVRANFDLPPGFRLGVGIARLDYTKGIEETFAAVERLLEMYPEYRGAFTFVQVAEPSRTRLPEYRELHARVRLAAGRVNRRFGHEGYCPAILLDTHTEPADVYRMLRAADVCVVGSLHDGMNLVAKEFVSARGDEQGALVLSQFTGAAGELTDALMVNPYDIDETAHALARALEMPPDEQRRRMHAMRATIAGQNAYRWAADMFSDVARVRDAAVPVVPPRAALRVVEARAAVG